MSATAVGIVAPRRVGILVADEEKTETMRLRAGPQSVHQPLDHPIAGDVLANMNVEVGTGRAQDRLKPLHHGVKARASGWITLVDDDVGDLGAGIVQQGLEVVFVKGEETPMKHNATLAALEVRALEQAFEIRFKVSQDGLQGRALPVKQFPAEAVLRPAGPAA